MRRFESARRLLLPERHRAALPSGPSASIAADSRSAQQLPQGGSSTESDTLPGETGWSPDTIAERSEGSCPRRPSSQAAATTTASTRVITTTSPQRPCCGGVGKPHWGHARRWRLTSVPHSRHFCRRWRIPLGGTRTDTPSSWRCRLGSFRPQCGHRVALELTFAPQSLHDLRLIARPLCLASI